MGGLAWWRHWVLRLLLWCSGALPLRLVPWLDEAAQRILLRKVGGGYRFIHDLFRDYLATLDPSERKSARWLKQHCNPKRRCRAASEQSPE
jgi:hypothetical protein